MSERWFVIRDQVGESKWRVEVCEPDSREVAGYFFEDRAESLQFYEEESARLGKLYMEDEVYGQDPD